MTHGYDIIEELAADELHGLYRGRRQGEAGTVLIKVPVSSPPRPLEIAALKREFEILKALAIDGVARAHALVESDGGCALVLEDAGGVLLQSLTGAKPLKFALVLDIAIQVSATLAELHRRDIVYRNLSPRSILIDASGRAQLIDFSGAAQGPAEASIPLPRHYYQTRLPYAAPEQTGRMNRIVDHRADFYSFGVVLYELLTGTRLFISDDPLELTHAHIAKTPVAPADVKGSIPTPVSQIILKLLAKTAEERYQSARGLQADLERCQREWSRHGRISAFAIASHDISERFTVPQRLYGRNSELALLLSAFDRACRGIPALLLVGGYAGIGKTSLIQELYKPIARDRGYFIRGKFDQLSRDIPFGALIQALQQLVQRLLTEEPARLERWRAELTEALGSNAGVLAEVIPELELIVGAQPPPAPLPPTEAQNRFILVFQNFFAAIAKPQHPLAVFLDDLQWADAATLQLLEPLLASQHIRGLFMIGAYRDNEVGPDHPLARTVRSLEQSGAQVHRIALNSLALPELTQLTADALHVAREDAEPLAELLLAKTAGNPFFVIQFLQTLHQEGLIAFDLGQGGWRYRLEDIRRADVTDNVIDLMTRRINRLSPAAQRTLTLAACVGNRFDLETLSTVSEQSLEATSEHLSQAAAESLVSAEAGGTFVFLHDRVQQAAYAKIPASEKPFVHLTVGRLLSTKRGNEETFDIASHLNIGAPLIESPEEKLGLAQLNLDAGRKAKLSTAYKAALGYFSAGIGLLDQGSWCSDYELAFSLNLEAAQCEYLCGEFDAAETKFATLFARAASSLDKARVYSLRMVQHENMSRYADAVASAREGLALFGVSFPDSDEAKQAALENEIDTVRSLLGRRTIESLIDLPAMTDPEIRMVMSILTDIWSSVYILGDAILARLISATMVRLSLLHGNSEESAYGYVTHAITVGPVRKDYESAYEFGRLALRVNERFNDARRRAKICQQFHAHVILWRQPMQTCIPYAQEACRSGLESGDFLYAAYGASTESWPAIVSTQDLAQFVRHFEPNLALIKKLKIASFADALALIMNWARALMGKTESPLSLSTESFDENDYLETYRINAFFTMFHAIAKLNLYYLFGEYAKALETARTVGGIVRELTGMIWTVLFDFWNGLTLAANYADATPEERRAYLKEMKEAQQSLCLLAENCPENFLCQTLLLSAEIERITGEPLSALDFYERALNYANATGMVQHQALANELSAKFWLERGNEKIAGHYLREARERYRQWGAYAKEASLVARYGELLGDKASVEMGASGGANHETLEISTILKAAHAIAEKIDLHEFLEQMLKIAIENAGARRGILIEQREGELFIAAEGTVDSDQVALPRETRLGSGPPRCSAAVVNYVYRTKVSLVIADAAQDERFAQDDYVARAQPKSILCLPIVHQGELSAILYLENNLIQGAFTPGRIEVMEILSGQAAISFEKARLFDRMKQEIAQRQHAEQDLKRALAERKRSEEMLRSIAEGTASVTGAEFFHSLVRHLASALQVRYAFVAECFVNEGRGERTKCARSRAFWKADGFGENFEYEVPGTPCMEVLDGEVCHYAAHVQELFPEDKDLVALGAQSYIGAPLVGASGEVIGHLAILDTKPIEEASVGMSVLKVFASRAGAELERLKADEGLKRAVAELERLKNQLQDENIYLRGELIANVSHDLRTPIALMQGYLETLLMKEDSLTAEKRRSYLEVAARQSEHLATLISELFELAKLDFRGYEIHAEPLHLGELAQDVLQKFQLDAEKKQVALQGDIHPEVDFVRADIGLMERALENLLENALKHTRPGDAISLAVLPENGRVMVRVSDTGSGIPEQHLPHIFERFYRVDKARTSGAGGAGLGLAIVKRILDLHGSEIRVESALQSGTTFSFALPTVPRGAIGSLAA